MQDHDPNDYETDHDASNPEADAAHPVISDQDDAFEQDLHKHGIFDPMMLRVGPYRWSHKSTPLLDDALAAAQGECRAAEENRNNPHLKTKYADLNAVIQAIREAFSRHGIARYQTPWTGHDNKLYITTRLACRGEWVEADFKVPFEELKGLRTIQSVGNAITYVKRYALTTMAGIASGDDDDGEAGPPEPERKRAPADEWPTACAAFKVLGIKPQVLLAHVGKQRAQDLTVEDHAEFKRLHSALKAREDWATKAIAKANEALADAQ